MFILDSNLAHRPKPEGTFTNPDLVLEGYMVEDSLPSRPVLYIEEGVVWEEAVHYMNGHWMTEATHTEESVYLFEITKAGDVYLPANGWEWNY